LAKHFNEKKENSDVFKQKSSETKSVWKKQSFVSLAVFLFSISIVIISLVSVVFPTLIASNNSVVKLLEDFGIELVDVEPFVLGVWATSLFIINVVVFTIAILFFKKKLPDFFLSSIKFIFSFEVSKKITFIVIVILLVIYVGFSVGELTTIEKWEDYPGIKKRIDNWSPEQITSTFEPHVKYFLHWSSMILFGYYTVIPFIASISLLLLIYFITVEISKKRFAGIVAMIILLQSNVFLTYDSTVSYSNFWILFFLFSLFVIYKFWPLSPLFYLLSILSKPITIFFLPMLLFFIFRSSISKKQKILTAIASTGIILLGMIVFFSYGIEGTQNLSPGDFDLDRFWLGFTSFSYQLRFDGLTLLFILPLIVGLFIASRNGFKQADSVMFLIGWMLLTAPILTGFTELTNQPYRFVPLIVFFAMGMGILLSKKVDYKQI